MAAASRNSTPSVAALPLATMIDMSVARPSAHGQAMIRTATALIRPCTQLGSGPNSPQPSRVMSDTATTASTKYRATRSADESMLTGEPLSVSKAPGDKLIGATVNTNVATTL